MVILTTVAKYSRQNTDRNVSVYLVSTILFLQGSNPPGRVAGVRDADAAHPQLPHRPQHPQTAPQTVPPAQGDEGGEPPQSPH